jgi:GNAT superfamily N-acetyltransferase
MKYETMGRRCARLLKEQNKWYPVLARQGFKDIEQDPTDPEGPLKKWSGVDGHAITDAVACQEPLQDVQSSFPAPTYARLEQLLTGDNLDACTDSIAHRPNTKLKQRQVEAVLAMTVRGMTERGIATKLKVNDSAVHRCLEALKEWSELVDSVEHKRQGTTDGIKIVCRPVNITSDAPFIFATWRNCVWYTKHPEGITHRGGQDFEAFVKKANEVIGQLLRKAQVKVACDEAQSDHIIGYSVSLDDHLEFVYVKSSYRSAGIGKMLLPRPCNTVSKPFTHVAEAILRNHPGRFKVKE